MRTHRWMHVLWLTALVGCHDKSPVDPPPELLPDLSGAWRFSFFGASVGSPASRVNCSLAPVQLQLQGSNEHGGQRDLVGTQAGGEVICLGLTAPELSMMGDSILPFPAGTVSGREEWFCSSILGDFCGNVTCDTALVHYVRLQINAQTIAGRAAARALGGSVGWMQNGVPVISGT